MILEIEDCVGAFLLSKDRGGWAAPSAEFRPSLVRSCSKAGSAARRSLDELPETPPSLAESRTLLIR